MRARTPLTAAHPTYVTIVRIVAAAVFFTFAEKKIAIERMQKTWTSIYAMNSAAPRGVNPPKR